MATLTTMECSRMFKLVLLLVIWAAAPGAYAQSQYLPLNSGNRWVLRHAGIAQAISLEVLDQSGDEYHLRFSSPFGTNEWMLKPQGERYYLTKYGANGMLADLPANTLYFDFGAKVHAGWSNTIGKISVDARDLTIHTQQGSYGNCIRIRQSAKMSFTFAPGKGFVAFGEGKDAFVLAESDSRIGTGGAQAAQSDDSLLAQPAPSSEKQVAGTGAAAAQTKTSPSAGSGPVLFSITPNVFANQKHTPENLLAALGTAERAGMGFLVHNGKWNELEARKGQYNFEALDFNVATAKSLNIPICYTLRIIETVERAMPDELRKISWSDPRLEGRLLALIQSMAPHFDGQVRWFLLGNEIDGYFIKHPNELADYAQLYRHVTARIKEIAPGIQVGATLQFGGVDLMDGMMKALTEQFDFICFTYYPFRGDFTMQDPNVVSQNVARMRTAAHGRKMVLQEMGYPSGVKNGSSEEMQSRFVENVFDVLRANNDFVQAGCFWLLADLSDELVDDLARYYGMRNSAVFKSFLQTLGMYDRNGRPKKAWTVYQSKMRAN